MMLTSSAQGSTPGVPGAHTASLVPEQADPISEVFADGLGNVLQADDSIKVGRTVARSPSSAARIALGGGPVDGWLRWRVARLCEKNLAELREDQ